MKAIFALLVVCSIPAFAAKQQTFKLETVDRLPAQTSEVSSFLSLPTEMIKQNSSRLGNEHLEILKSIAKDATNNVDLRWRAIYLGAQINFNKFSPEIKAALNSPEWFMRMAALNAVNDFSPTQSSEFARILIKDKALVVRTAAADVLMKSGTSKDREVLWSSLFDKANSHKGKSLWLRPKILKHLAKTTKNKNEMSRFVPLLNDKDQNLQELALGVLEEKSDFRVGSHKTPIEKRKSMWLAWAKREGISF